MNIKEILNAKPFPNFIKNHKIFDEFTTVKKVFPSIGLSNCKEKVVVDKTDSLKPLARYALNEVRAQLSKRSVNLSKWIEKALKEEKKISEERVLAAKEVISFMSSLAKELESADNFITKSNDGKLVFRLASNMQINEKNKYKAGEALFRVYGKVAEFLTNHKFASLPKLDNLANIKTFNAENIPENNKYIYFSSDGLDGAWDIATMSQRGIRSCQSWNGAYKQCLVGSILDPYVAVMYYASDKDDTNYGPKMIRRCVVRMIVNSKTREPALFLDYMYPSPDTNILNAFKNFLEEKTHHKFEIITNENGTADLTNYFLPKSKVIDKLIDYSNFHNTVYDGAKEGILSYQDTVIKSKSVADHNKYLKYRTNVSTKLTNLAEILSAGAFKDINTDNELLDTVFKTLAKSTRFKNCLSLFLKDNLNLVLDRSSFKNSNQYYKMLLFKLLNNRTETVKVLGGSFTDMLKKSTRAKVITENLTVELGQEILNQLLISSKNKIVNEVKLLIKNKK